MTITGDFDKLADFAAKTGKLDTFVRDVALGSVKGIEAATVAQFSTSADPYGNPWAPMKRGGGAPLASLSGEVEVTAFGEGKIRASAEFPLNFHNSGTRQLSEKSALKSIRAKAKGRLSKQRFKDSRADFKEAAKLASAAGGQHDPKRQVVPGAGKTPETWDAVITETAEQLFAKVLA
jgi:hypothetical protein